MFLTTFCSSISTAAALLFATTAFAADPPRQKPGDWTVNDFRFHTGEVLPELKLHYVTIGEPTGQPVLVLHGSNGSGQMMLGPNFAGELFGPGQPLDAAKYFLIVPDAVGSGGSSKPSNGLRMAFPKFTYEDQVRAQYRLLTEHLGVKHLKLIIGQSMGGMLAWMWGEMYPDSMDVLVPLGSQPAAMSGRNWVLRRMLIDAIKADPAWNNGDYTQEPPTFKYVATFFSFATAGGTRSFLRRAPTRALADKLVEQRLAEKFTPDANDYIYAYDAARDYDPSPGLETIKARVLAINAADDERNPAELGIVAREIKRVKNGTYYEIPASPETNGHGTSGDAKWWKHLLPELLSDAKPGRNRAQAIDVSSDFGVPLRPPTSADRDPDLATFSDEIERRQKGEGVGTGCRAEACDIIEGGSERRPGLRCRR